VPFLQLAILWSLCDNPTSGTASNGGKSWVIPHLVFRPHKLTVVTLEVVSGHVPLADKAGLFILMDDNDRPVSRYFKLPDEQRETAIFSQEIMVRIRGVRTNGQFAIRRPICWRQER